MKRLIITIGTVTYAIKAKELLRKKGYKVFIERVSSNSNGCTYAVIVDSDSYSAIEILRNAGIKIIDIKEK